MKTHFQSTLYKSTLFLVISLLFSVSTRAQLDDGRDVVIKSNAAVANEEIVARKSVTLKHGFTTTGNCRVYLKPDLYNEPVPSKTSEGLSEACKGDNYIFTQVFRKEVNNIDDFENSATGTNKDIIENVQYFDGLGRLIQTVDIKGSPSKNDITVPVEYDDYGRELKKYMPYTQISDGRYRSYAIESELPDFYNSPITGREKTDSRPFTEIEYDNSPLNRVMAQTGPGIEWNTAGKKTTFEYGSNASSVVAYFYINGSDNCLRDGWYDANRLFRTKTTDESGKSVTEYKDKQGLVICKAGELETKTYYVYDDFNLLRFVLPPKATDYVLNKGNTVSEIADSLCFSYKYDERHRMIEKKIPGAHVVYMIYDKLDRLVLIQDGNLRMAGKWMFTTYDKFNRVAVTGLLTNSSPWPDLINFYKTTTYINVERTSQNWSTFYGYDQNCLPSGTNEILTVAYYDTHDFNLDGTADRTFNNTDGLTAVEYPTSKKGLVTATKTKVLGSTTYIDAASFYDRYGRLIQVQKYYPDNNVSERITTEYNFIGEVLRTKTTTTVAGASNTILDTYTYDHSGRLTDIKKKVNSQPETAIVSNTYNELGELITERLGPGSTAALQKTDYTYNIRGWLGGINNTFSSSENDLFGMKLYYTSFCSYLAGTEQYNGNISAMKWINNENRNTWKAYGFEYDQLNRLNNAIYGEYNSAGSDPNTGYLGTATKDKFNEQNIQYDLNGNIITLNRWGITNQTEENVEVMDNLVYVYNGNRLKKVKDNSVSIVNGRGDFKDGANTDDDYSYDANGNMTKDKNKDINTIEYNELNLPKKITWTNNNYIQYTYDAGGTKLKETIYSGGAVTGTEWYYGSNVYKRADGSAITAGDLNYILAEKGRLVKSGSNFNYEYFLKDHLGNTRVVFSDANGNGAIDNTTEVLQYASYYPFGLAHNRWKITSDDNRRLYNGKELQTDLNLDLYDYGARFYDPQIGRWHSVDPSAETYYSWTPYNYCANNPIVLIDPDGTDWYEDKDGNRMWKDGNGEVEGYTRMTENFTMTSNGDQNTTFTYDPAQQDPVEMTETVLTPDKFVAQEPDQCYKGAKAMTEKTGITTVSHRVDNNGGIATGKESGTSQTNHTVNPTKDAQKGIDYIDNAINNGYAPTVGVDYKYQDPKTAPNGGTTDHYVTLSSRTTNLSNGTKMYGFFETGRYTAAQGTQSMYKFSVSSNRLLKSEHGLTGPYKFTVSFVPYLKKQ